MIILLCESANVLILNEQTDPMGYKLLDYDGIVMGMTIPVHHY